MADHLEEFLQTYPAVPVILCGVGARESHGGLKKELRTHATKPYLTHKSHKYVQAASVNSTFAGAGREVAVEVQQLVEEDKKIWRNLERLEQIIERDQKNTTWCGVQSDGDMNKSIQDKDKMVAFKEISQRLLGCSWYVL